MKDDQVGCGRCESARRISRSRGCADSDVDYVLQADGRIVERDDPLRTPLAIVPGCSRFEGEVLDFVRCDPGRDRLIPDDGRIAVIDDHLPRFLRERDRDDSIGTEIQEGAGFGPDLIGVSENLELVADG